jgi:hypothetical protein
LNLTRAKGEWSRPVALSGFSTGLGIQKVSFCGQDYQGGCQKPLLMPHAASVKKNKKGKQNIEKLRDI